VAKATSMRPARQITSSRTHWMRAVGGRDRGHPGPGRGNRRGLGARGCMKGVPKADGRCLRFPWFMTLFAVERVTRIELALSAWESDTTRHPRSVARSDVVVSDPT